LFGFTSMLLSRESVMSKTLGLNVECGELSASDSIMSGKAVQQHPHQWMKRVVQIVATIGCGATVGMVMHTSRSLSSGELHARNVLEVLEFAHSDEVIGAIRWNTFCFDVQDGKAENGANLQIWGCEQGGQHDNRRFIHGVNGTVRWAAHPDLCLDVAGGERKNGANIQLWECGADGESPNQQFILPAPGSGGRIRWVSNPSKCFDIAGGRKQNGNNVETWDCDEAKENPNQHFKISDGIASEVASSTQEGAVTTGSIHWNNFCFDVQDGNADNGANLQIWECEQNEENNNRRFTYGNGTGAVRWAAHPDFCLDVADGKTDNGANIQFWECGADGEAPNQQFILPAPGSRGRIRWASNPSKCFDIAGGREENGTNIETWDCDDTKENPNQMYKLSE